MWVYYYIYCAKYNYRRFPREAAETTGVCDMSLVDKIFGTFSDKELKKIRPIADKVLALDNHGCAYR